MVNGWNGRRSATYSLVAFGFLTINLESPEAKAQALFGEALFGTTSYAPNSVAEPKDFRRPRVYIRPRFHSDDYAQKFYCVRTCDGRFFPLPNSVSAKNVEVCETACPSAEMKLYFGSDIENSKTGGEQTYKELTNAFRYRREMVPTCSCNPYTTLGLASISIENDPTIRAGDIVANASGFVIATVPDVHSGRRRGDLIFRPISDTKAQALGLSRLLSRRR